MYGSGKVEVRLNNELIDQEEAGACGNITFGYSPTVREKSHTHKHSIFELSFKASQGSFGVQLHDPGPRFGCDVLETEVTTFIGDLTPDGCTFQTESTETFNQRWDELPPIGYFDTSSTTISTTTITTLTTTISTTTVTTRTAAPPTTSDYGDSTGITEEEDNSSSEDGWVPRTRCNFATDILFVLDASGSINNDEWKKMKSFVDRTMQSFTGNVRFGVMSYGDDPRLRWHINDGRVNTNSQSNKAARDLVWKMRQKGCGFLGLEMCSTFTGKAMKYVESTAMRKRRYQGIPLIVITITDGVAADQSDVKKYAAEIQNAGVVMFAVDVGGNNFNAALANFKDLASEPKNDRIFDYDDFGALVAGIRPLVTAVCKSINPTLGNNDCYDYHARWDTRTVQTFTPVATPSACNERCKALSTCKHWYWMVNNRLCGLQGASVIKRKLTNQYGVVSGPKNCPGSFGYITQELTSLAAFVASLTGGNPPSPNQPEPPTPAPRTYTGTDQSCYDHYTRNKDKHKARAYPVTDIHTCQRTCAAQKHWVWVKWCDYYEWNSRSKECFMYKKVPRSSRKINDAHSTSAKVSCFDQRCTARNSCKAAPSQGGRSSTGGWSSGGNGDRQRRQDKGDEDEDAAETADVAPNAPVVFDPNQPDFDCDIDPAFYGPGAVLPEFCSTAVDGDVAVLSVAMGQDMDSADGVATFQNSVVDLIAEKAGVRPDRVRIPFSTAGSVIVSAIIKEGDTGEISVEDAQANVQTAIESGNFSVVAQNGTTLGLKTSNATQMLVSKAMTEEDLILMQEDLAKIEEELSAPMVIEVDTAALDIALNESVYNPANIKEGDPTPPPPDGWEEDDFVPETNGGGDGGEPDDAGSNDETDEGDNPGSSPPSVCQVMKAKFLFYECEDDGSFVKQQCYGEECWCVNSAGKEMVGSRDNATTFESLEDNIDCETFSEASAAEDADGGGKGGRIAGTVIGILIATAVACYLVYIFVLPKDVGDGIESSDGASANATVDAIMNPMYDATGTDSGAGGTVFFEAGGATKTKMYTCDNKCGFKGTFAIVEEHEKTCTVVVDGATAAGAGGYLEVGETEETATPDAAAPAGNGEAFGGFEGGDSSTDVKEVKQEAFDGFGADSSTDAVADEAKAAGEAATAETAAAEASAAEEAAATDPAAESTAEPAAVPAAEPAAEAAAEPVAEPAAEPVAEPTAEPVAEPTAEPAAEPTAEPAAVPAVEPATEPATEPAAEPEAIPAPDAANGIML